MWLWSALISAVLLGLYDVAKKHALGGNAVLPVLLSATISGAVVVVPLIGLSRWMPESVEGTPFFIPSLSIGLHGLILVKAALVSLSWILAYFSLKHLPISIVSPIRASAPAWTVVGAVLLFGESPTPIQWAGLGLIFGSYYAFSLAGRKEGIVFHRNPWILCIIGATVTGSICALYDKYLLQRLGVGPLTLQAWFSVYLVLIQGALVAGLWFPRRAATTRFAWRWSIPAIGLLLVASDLIYFRAVHQPGALIALVSPLRRTGVVISFVLGGILFTERNMGGKALPLAGVLAGVFLVLFGPRG